MMLLGDGASFSHATHKVSRGIGPMSALCGASVLNVAEQSVNNRFTRDDRTTPAAQPRVRTCAVLNIAVRDTSVVLAYTRV